VNNNSSYHLPILISGILYMTLCSGGVLGPEKVMKMMDGWIDIKLMIVNR